MSSSRKTLKQYKPPKVKAGWDRRKVHLEDEMPALGCGVRLVDFKVGRKWVYVRTPYDWAGRSSKVPLAAWNKILASRGNRRLGGAL